MGEDLVTDGVRQFAKNAEATITKVTAQPWLITEPVVFEARFAEEQNSTFISFELLGTVVSYVVVCGSLSGTAAAPALLRRNSGGVESTCFYFSVHLQDEKPWLSLETRQYLEPDATAEEVASMLGFCRLQYLQAREAIP